MVARLHAAGIEVILDVVYNHTGEGGETGPTLSFRGLDNLSYYRLTPGRPRLCQRHRHRQHAERGSPDGAADDPRFAALLGEVMHVDGFRFDLCGDAGPHR
jgi:isoamylase